MSDATFMRRRVCRAGSSIALMVLAAAPVKAASANAAVIGYDFDVSRVTGQQDLTLTPDVLSNAVLHGLRSGGISPLPNPKTADYVVDVRLDAAYEPALQSLRIVAGTLSLRAPRPNAPDFQQPILLCSYNVFTWRAGPDSRDLAQRVRDDIVRQAALFARECKPVLSGR